jgi:DnaJ-class molecular chaperone
MKKFELDLVLEISRTASAEEIQNAYRKKAKQFHPDRNIGDKEAEGKFKKVQEAKDLANSNQNASPDVANQKESDIDTIINGGKYTGLRSALQTFEPAYLKDWARAVLNNQTQFTHKNIKYNVQGGGKLIKK